MCRSFDLNTLWQRKETTVYILNTFCIYQFSKNLRFKTQNHLIKASLALDNYCSQPMYLQHKSEIVISNPNYKLLLVILAKINGMFRMVFPSITVGQNTSLRKYTIIYLLYDFKHQITNHKHMLILEL